MDPIERASAILRETFRAASPSTPPTASTKEATIGPYWNPHEVRELALVLASMQIPHSVRASAHGDSWTLLVPTSEHQRALDTIQIYRAENRDWPPRRVREVLPYRRSLVAPLVVLGLVLFYAVVGPGGSTSWTHGGVAVADRILAGQIWRAATALTLHADATHIFGNAISGAVFFSAVNRRLGDGRGTLLVLLSGTLGNVLNAAWYRTGHASIGASTAVMGAIGLLVATQLAVDRQHTPRSWTERIAPIMGGLALLGSLGASPSPQTDLLAHLYGFAAGLLLGVPFLVRKSALRATPRFVQIGAGLLAAGLMAGSWTLACLVPS